MFTLFKPNPERSAAELAYHRVVEQARRPGFFLHGGVPDTVDGRFELICLHAFLYLHRLKSERPRSARLGRHFVAVMFADFDRSLREMGVGDISVGKHVKRMARAFYGRVLSYEAGLAGNDSVLAAALARNLFGTGDAPPSAADAMTAYVRGVVRGLSSQPTTDLLAGQASFEAPSGTPPHRPCFSGVGAQ